MGPFCRRAISLRNSFSCGSAGALPDRCAAMQSPQLPPSVLPLVRNRKTCRICAEIHTKWSQSTNWRRRTWIWLLVRLSDSQLTQPPLLLPVLSSRVTDSLSAHDKRQNSPETSAPTAGVRLPAAGAAYASPWVLKAGLRLAASTQLRRNNHETSFCLYPASVEPGLTL